MDKRGYGHKGLFCNTIDNVQTTIQCRYNPRTDYIGIHSTFSKSQGWNSGIINNKNCNNYLGITIAEQLLVKIFNNVEVMPPHNKGYDIICNQGFKIDIKSSIEHKQIVKDKEYKRWLFGIKRNPIADYFLCLAFDNRENLNPLHIWLIPSKRIAHLSTLTIAPSAIDKWSEFELTDKLDKVISCCNIMKGDN